jgi:hypothetical protein
VQALAGVQWSLLLPFVDVYCVGVVGVVVDVVGECLRKSVSICINSNTDGSRQTCETVVGMKRPELDERSGEAVG